MRVCSRDYSSLERTVVYPPLGQQFETQRPFFLSCTLMSRFITLSLLALYASTCFHSTDALSSRLLDPWLPWHGTNRARLNDLLLSHRNTSSVALFDFDNTIIKNDVGDLTLSYMLRNDHVRQPPDKDYF